MWHARSQLTKPSSFETLARDSARVSRRTAHSAALTMAGIRDRGVDEVAAQVQKGYETELY
jgi:hypothetical protein